MEEWRQIGVAPRYEVSNLGRVRNLKTKRLLKPHLDKHGDLNVNMWRYPYGKRVGGAVRVKSLVMHNFCPKIPFSKSYVIRCKDGNKLNCAFDNLYYQHRRELTIENWSLGKMEEARKKNPFKPGHKLTKPFPRGSLHPRWNPKSPEHLRDLKRGHRLISRFGLT